MKPGLLNTGKTSQGNIGRIPQVRSSSQPRMQSFHTTGRR
jgi:hypothetical protein